MTINTKRKITKLTLKYFATMYPGYIFQNTFSSYSLIHSTSKIARTRISRQLIHNNNRIKNQNCIKFLSGDRLSEGREKLFRCVTRARCPPRPIRAIINDGSEHGRKYRVLLCRDTRRWQHGVVSHLNNTAAN